jgi:tetratricopeptide (TPR) repeat protein
MVHHVRADGTRCGTVIESVTRSGQYCPGKVTTMERNPFYNRAGSILAVGLVAWISGCGSFDAGAPRPKLSWNQDGRSERVTPAKAADVQIAFGRVAEQQGDIEGAEAAYRAALKRDKTRGDAHLHLANIQTLKGEYRQAVDAYQKALEANPGNPDVFCDMGYSLYLQHKWADAERNLKQALAINPDHPRAHNNLALVFAHTDRSEEALAEFREAGNSFADAHVNLAFSLSLDQRWQSAREESRRALAANPSSDGAKVRLREIDRLIVSNDKRAGSPGATRDAQAVAVSASRPIPPPRHDLAGTQRSPSKPVKIPPPRIFGPDTQ